MTACHGVPCASAAAQAMATAGSGSTARFERESPDLVRHDAFRRMRPRQLPALRDHRDLALEPIAARAEQHVDHGEAGADQRHRASRAVIRSGETLRRAQARRSAVDDWSP